MNPNTTTKPKLFVLLETIRSAYNVGSIFRSADSAGIDKLFLCSYTACPPHPKVAKTALGSSRSVSWEHHCDPIRLLKLLKKEGIRIVVAEPKPIATNVFDATCSQDTCIVFGHEELGVSDEAMSLADEIIQVPHVGIKESLNVAVAAGVVIYEYRRKLSFPK